MKKQAIMPVIVLTVICVVIAALVGGVHELTKDRIADNALKKEQASLIDVMPGAELFDEVTEKPDGTPSTIKTIYRERNGLGYVFIVVAEKTSYSSGDMTISVGVSNGVVLGAKITSYNESRDLGKETYPNNFVGKTEADFNDVEVTADVTYSSKAFKSAIGDALACEKLLTSATAFNEVKLTINSSNNQELPKTDLELEALIAELVPDATFEEKALPYGADQNLKKMYSTSKGGYVAYIVVPGQYVPVATEALVYVNNSGAIESINLLQWVVGHGVEPGDFAKGFIGTDIYHIKDVDLVTGATGTAGDFKNALTRALDSLTDLMNAREAAIIRLVDEIIPNSGEIKKLDLPDGAPETLIGLYTDSNGRGTVAHIVVPGEWVPVATEALVFFNNYGEIRDVKMMQWVVGHGVGHDGFEEGFIGASGKEEIDEVELVATATGTSSDFRNAVAEIHPYIPVKAPTLKIIAASVLVVFVAGLISAVIITRKRWACR